MPLPVDWTTDGVAPANRTSVSTGERVSVIVAFWIVTVQAFVTVIR